MWENRERMMVSVLTLNSAPAFEGLWPGGNSDLVGRCWGWATVSLLGAALWYWCGRRVKTVCNSIEKEGWTVTRVVSWFLTRVSRPFHGERTVFATKGTGKTGYPVLWPNVRAKEWSSLTLHIKMNSTWIKDLVFRAKAIKLFEENREENLHWILFSGFSADLHWIGQ